MRANLLRIQNWYFKHERPISSISLVVGFAFDAIIFTQVNLFWEGVIISSYLAIVAVSIILVHAAENKSSRSTRASKIHFWLINILQFFFGGLLSTFLVSYFRSSTLGAAWPFLLILMIGIIANETLKKHYARLTFQISFFFLALFSFAVYFFPILFHRIGTDVFVVSGFASLAFLWLFLSGLKFLAKENFKRSRFSLTASIITIFLGMNVLYILNLIPPIPLSLKDGGVYHSLYRDADGNYVAEAEAQSWLHFLYPSPDFHFVPGDTVYAYSAVFSPGQFKTTIIHNWQKYDAPAKTWVTVNRITLPVSGGRNGGYRTYSVKDDVEEGDWRVNVETIGGQVIGRLRFTAIIVGTKPVLETIIKK